MSVKIAKNSGFCFGVKRAINIALEAAQKHKKTVTLGPIIHNPQMVEKLNEKGILSVNDHSEIKGRATIIRSHGVEKNILEKLKNDDIEIINATCPYVSKTQEFAKQLGEEGYQVIILGDKDHPEVIALKSYTDGNAIIVSNANELPKQISKKVGVISQTTRNIEDLQELVRALVPRCNDLKVINTICNATAIRQEATLKLAKESDVMIVIGGKNSSNTKMLAKISAKIIETYHIEIADEIDEKWFKGKCNIGLTAGASTPDWIIVEVYNKIIECLENDQNLAACIDDIPGFKEKNDV
ncbi:MAG TPA: 4-hydroxy-3-methylbut-2-enyl diphosphate reductase [Candidatus Cloacimonetes bacterium]|nr:4-hydroxy-3-methylbut-2-enyl diphosphate reductase [Candidatus Cloacimonadota bacterium]